MNFDNLSENSKIEFNPKSCSTPKSKVDRKDEVQSEPKLVKFNRIYTKLLIIFWERIRDGTITKSDVSTFLVLHDDFSSTSKAIANYIISKNSDFELEK